MSTKRKSSESEIREQSRVALENVEAQPQIASYMAEYEYGPETITQGKTLYDAAEQAFKTNVTEDDETSAAYKKFEEIKDELEKRYSDDRKKAKIIFRKDALSREKLNVTGLKPTTYLKWLEAITKFYSTVTEDAGIQGKLARLKITPEYLTETNTMIGELKSARADYLREVGESQDATKAKDEALANLEEWMYDFYAVAEIALEDHPQLLESLGKFVRS